MNWLIIALAVSGLLVFCLVGGLIFASWIYDAPNDEDAD